VRPSVFVCWDRGQGDSLSSLGWRLLAPAYATGVVRNRTSVVRSQISHVVPGFGVLFGLARLVGRMGCGGLAGFHQVGRLPARMFLWQYRIPSTEYRVVGAATEETLL
jgi:hypothetical protein